MGTAPPPGSLQSSGEDRTLSCCINNGIATFGKILKSKITKCYKSL